MAAPTRQEDFQRANDLVDWPENMMQEHTKEGRGQKEVMILGAEASATVSERSGSCWWPTGESEMDWSKEKEEVWREELRAKVIDRNDGFGRSRRSLPFGIVDVSFSFSPSSRVWGERTNNSAKNKQGFWVWFSVCLMIDPQQKI